MLAIVGNKVAPRVADRYLARTGYESQQTDTPTPPGRRDNLWAPVPGDHGAHGSFDDRAASWTLQLWLSLHRRQLALAAGSALAAAAGAWAAGRVRRRRAPDAA